MRQKSQFCSVTSYLGQIPVKNDGEAENILAEIADNGDFAEMVVEHVEEGIVPLRDWTRVPVPTGVNALRSHKYDGDATGYAIENLEVIDYVDASCCFFGLAMA